MAQSLALVAPARERGLKYIITSLVVICLCRSRKGAWIEIFQFAVRSHYVQVAPARERGLKSHRKTHVLRLLRVAPARERGLK